MITYPIRVRMSPALIEELRECELGSFEDYTGLINSGDPEDNAEARDMIFGTVHRYEILER
jgi:hypothetical protein